MTNVEEPIGAIVDTGAVGAGLPRDAAYEDGVQCGKGLGILVGIQMRPRTVRVRGYDL